MKQFILAIVLLTGGFSTYAESEIKNDTVTLINTKIQKIIQDETTNSKGKKVVKYYVLYDGKLIRTSKSVVEAYNLCIKYDAECALAMVINRKTNKKRIILN